MLQKQISYDHSITELGEIKVREITRIMEDGKELSKTYHRHVISPGDDIVGQDERTVLIAGVIYTPKVMAEYEAVIAEKRVVKNDRLYKNNQNPGSAA